MDGCPYKYLFGTPGEGAHSVRIPILDIAVVDTLATIVTAFLIQKVFYPDTPYFTVLILFTILGEILHVLFCVRTRVTTFIIDDI
jgi:hypothetical protein